MRQTEEATGVAVGSLQDANQRELASTQTGASRLRVTEVPHWVSRQPYGNPAQIEDAYISNGFCMLLRDTQTNLADGITATYVRLVHRVLTTAGASQVAQFSASFDPLTQELEIHSIAVKRGDDIREHARIKSIDLIRREKNLERQILDGRLTASLIIPDVQPGDVVERSWTIYGGNPVLANFFDQWTGFGGAALDLRHRLRTPASRSVHEKIFGESPVRTQSELDGIVDRSWSVSRAPRETIEPFTPPWQLLQRSLQLSEVESWSALSRLYAPHYTNEDYPEELRAEAEKITSQTGKPLERMMAALETVQKRVRYLSLALGEGGVIPRPLAEIWRTGYGDCKDASCLFAALAKLCGLNAVPALVATQYGPVINDWLPGAAAFNHCITRVAVGDSVYWIDPTVHLQARRAEHLTNFNLGWALPLRPDGSELEEMAIDPPSLTLDARETLTFGPKVSSPARLDLVLSHYNGFADLRRRQIANQGLSAVAEHYLKRYQGHWQQIVEMEPMRVSEDETADSLTLRVSYSLPTPWKTTNAGTATFSLPDFDLFNELGKIATNKPRSCEIFLGRPRILKKQTEAHMPKRWDITSKLYDESFKGAKYTKSLYSSNGNVVNYRKELTVSAATTPSSEIDAYNKLAEALNDRGGLTLSGRIGNDKFVDGSPKSKRSVMFYLWMGLIGLMVLGRIISAISTISQNSTQNQLTNDRAPIGSGVASPNAGSDATKAP